jgi:pimeloyl-ACP methyl ester carboxylesterase
MAALEPLEQVIVAPDRVRHTDVTVSDGVRIHVMEAGAGVPVVLLHGYTSGNDASWFSNGIARELAKDHRVIGIDARGHGRSEKPHDPAKYPGDRMASDVIEVLERLGVGKAHIHGYSMGGGLVAQLMARRPDLFITGSFGGSGVRETDPDLAAKAEAADPKGLDPRQDEARARLAGRSDRDSVALEAVNKGRQANPASTPPLDLTTIAFPVLAVNGEFDAPVSKTQRMARELRDFRSVVLPGRGHNTVTSAGYIPALYIETLAEFIRAH